MELITVSGNFSHPQVNPPCLSTRVPDFPWVPCLVWMISVKLFVQFSPLWMALFAALTRMRQVCCDPRLLDHDLGESIGSAKLNTLMDMVHEILDEGHSALIFSQFTSMLTIIEKNVRKQNMP